MLRADILSTTLIAARWLQSKNYLSNIAIRLVNVPIYIPLHVFHVFIRDDYSSFLKHADIRYYYSMLFCVYIYDKLCEIQYKITSYFCSCKRGGGGGGRPTLELGIGFGCATEDLKLDVWLTIPLNFLFSAKIYKICDSLCFIIPKLTNIFNFSENMSFCDAWI